VSKEESHPKYLRNTNTGAIQAWSRAKAQLPFMEPHDKPPEPREATNRRTKRPYDVEQERRAKVAKADAARESVLADDDAGETGGLALSPEDLDECEAQLKSAMSKDDIAALANDYFGIEISTASGVKRADMKDDVRSMIELARKDLEKA